MSSPISLPLFDRAPAATAAGSPAAVSARLRAALGRPVRYHLVTLGCPKNVADSESFERRLAAAGCVAEANPRRADVLVANTCGFIEQSQQESINAILALGKARHAGQALIAAGCLITLNRDELAAELPEVTALFDPHQWNATVDAVTGHGLLAGAATALARLTSGALPAAEALDLLAEVYEPQVIAGIDATRLAQALHDAGAGFPEPAAAWRDIPAATGPQRVSAYLKISDGCNAPCTFCIIPQIKGPLYSLPLPAIVEEAQRLYAGGARELVLVAQDSTAYGEDTGVRDGLPHLLEALAEAVPAAWLRLMYAYPGRVSRRLIETMAALPQVTPYLDVPLQHGSVATLRRMRRPANLAMVRQMIAALRAAMPEIALRTSLITGFPGETDAEFEELLSFVREIRFDHVGVFTYSQQDRARSAAHPGQVSELVKRERRRRVMETQQPIALERQRTFIGRELTVLVEGVTAPAGRGRRRLPGPVVTGRSYRDAPEVDGTVVAAGHARPGTFVQVRVTDAGPYDLFGDVLGPAPAPGAPPPPRNQS